MKTTLRYLSLNAQGAWHRQVEAQLQHLHSLTPITAAEVVLEHQREWSAYRAQAMKAFVIGWAEANHVPYEDDITDRER